MPPMSRKPSCSFSPAPTREAVYNLAHPDRLRAGEFVKIWKAAAGDRKPSVLFVPHFVAACARLILEAGKLL